MALRPQPPAGNIDPAPDPVDGPRPRNIPTGSFNPLPYIISPRRRPRGPLRPKYLDSTAPVSPVDRQGRELGLTAAKPGDPIPYIFGNTLVTPIIIAAKEYQSKLYVDYLIGQGEIDEIESVWVNGENIGLPASWEFYTGTSGQATSALMKTAIGNSPESYDALADIAHVVAVLGSDDSIDVRFQVKGLKLLDPRSSPLAYSYSNNPALALARILVDCGYQVDWDTVTTAANICDQTIGDGVRWTVDLPAMARRPLPEWLETLAAYAHVWLDNHGGVFKFIPDAEVTTSPVISRTVTEANILAGSARTQKAGTRDVPNQVTISYRQLDGNTRTATAGAGNTGEITALQMPGFSEYTMAKRMAIETLNKAQADLTHSHVATDVGLADSIGDIHSITYAPHGIYTKWMRLIGYEQIERGRWRRDYLEYSASFYNDSVYVEPDWSDTLLSNPNEPPDGPTPTVVEELYTDETATTYSRLKITWTGVNYVYAQDYKVVVEGEQRVMNQLINHDGAVAHTVYTDAVKQDVLYTISIWVRSVTRALSAAPGTATITAQGKLLPPGDVPAYTSLGEAGGLIYAAWQAAEEIDGDLRGYILKLLPDADYTGTSADWTDPNVTMVANRLDAQSILFQGPTSGTYWLGIKAIDTTGNVSTNALWGQVIVTTDAWQTNFEEVIEDPALLVNMHVYTIDGSLTVDGGGRYCVTSTSETWLARFGDTSPLATWGDAVTQSPAERWGGDLQTDSTFVSAAWDKGATVDGRWTWTDSTVTVLGGTQANAMLISEDTSPLSYTETAGSSVQDTGRYAKAKTYTSDSPAGVGDGLHIRLPVLIGFSGEVVPQSGAITIPEESPLTQNPYTVTFSTAYSGVPKISLTAGGNTAKIAVADNVTATGMDIYLFNLSGEKVSGTVYWTSEGI